jgi:hypothetical protein
MKSKYIFYIILIIEFFTLPFKYIFHWSQVLLKKDNKKNKTRLPVYSKEIRVVIHEWGGYDSIRFKKIKNGIVFECGLTGQLKRFLNKPNVNLTITMSDAWMCKDLASIKNIVEVIPVPNVGMDFSGYFAYFEKIKDLPNQYVIFTNSSVNLIQEEFLSEYINYMEQNYDVGMLGISYCTKMIQTLMRINFMPHLQSFFLLTTIDVMNQVIKLNKGKFPGANIDYKLLLIRNGEIFMSKLIQKLGYNIAVVNPVDGNPYKFTSYRKWSIPFGDIRQIIKTPNRITPIHYNKYLNTNK